MSTFILILLAYYIYLLGKGLIVAERPWGPANYIILLVLVLMVVAFVFTLKKAIREARAQKEEDAKVRAEYERKRAEKVKAIYREAMTPAPTNPPAADATTDKSSEQQQDDSGQKSE